MKQKTRLVAKINGYPVYLWREDFGFNLECNDVMESGSKIHDIINKYIMFQEYFTVEENHIIINKDEFGRELFGMVVSLTEFKKVYFDSMRFLDSCITLITT